MIEIIINQTGAGRYAATLNGRTIVQGTRTPLLCSARALLAEGADSEAILGMRRATSPTNAMTGRIDALAALTVHEGESPRFTRYHPPPAELRFATATSPRQQPSPSNPSATSSEPSKPILEPHLP